MFKYTAKIEVQLEQWVSMQKMKSANWVHFIHTPLGMAQIHLLSSSKQTSKIKIK